MDHALYYIIGIYLLAVVGSRIVLLQRILGMRLQNVDYLPSQFDKLPADLQVLFKAESERLETLGFSVLFTQFSHTLFRHAQDERWSLVMLNRDSGVYAEILFASTFEEMPGTEVQFYSFARDGRVLCTLRTRSQSMLVNSGGLSMSDEYAVDTREQYQNHLQRSSSWLQQSQPVVTDQAGYTSLRRKTDDLFYKAMLQDKTLLPCDGGLYRFSLRGAFRLAGVVTKGRQKIRKLERQRTKQVAGREMNSPRDSQAPLEADVRAYKYATAFNERRSTGLLGRSLAFAATLIVSYFAFGLIFSYKTVVILLGVVLFHELGHLLAMLVFGYRDLRILFIPLLGGVAIGKNDEVAVWKQVIVYLMGPLPGIILGLVLLSLKLDSHSSWLYETTMLLLLINYLNLLPVLPLDGGHIIRLTLLERFPVALVIFNILSGLLFLGGAVFTADPIFWFLAVVMLLTIPNSISRSRLLNTLGHKAGGGESPDARLLRVFAKLREPPYQALRFIQKYRLVKSINDFLMQKRHCSLPASMGLLVVYLCILLVTPAVALYGVYGAEASQLISAILGDKPQPVDWDKRIADAGGPRQRIRAQVNAAYLQMGQQNYSKALAYLQQAETSAGRFNRPEDNALVHEAYSYYYKQQGMQPQFLKNLQEAIRLRESALPGHEFSLSQNYLTLSEYIYSRHDLDGYEYALSKALDYAYKTSHKGDMRYVGPGQARLILNKLQDFYYLQRQPDKVKPLLQAALAKLAQAGDYQSILIRQALYEDLGWWAIEDGDPQQAIEYFKQSLAVIDKIPSPEPAKLNSQLSQAQAIRPNLEIACVYYRQNDLQTARQYIARVSQLVEMLYHSSLDKYLSATRGSGDEDVSMDSPRLLKHWRLLRECYQNSKS